MLLSCVPPRKTPDPDPSVHERPAASPSPSATETCVVPGRGPEPSGPYASATARASASSGGSPSWAAMSSRIRLTTAPPCDGVERTSRPRIVELERFRLEDSVGAEVVAQLRKQLDEHRRTGIADALERRARVSGANAGGIAVDATPTVVALEDPGEDRVQEHALLVPLEALARDRDGRLDELSPLARRESTMDRLEPGQQAGHGDGALADVEHLRPRVAEVDDELLHLAEARRRHTEEAVEHGRRAARLVHEREPAAGRAGERPLGHERGERRGEERVHRVPALAQDSRARLGRQRMTGCDRPSHRGNRTAAR